MARPTPIDLTQIHRLMGQAAAAYARNDSMAAGLLCERVLSLYPDMPEALHLLGLCFMARGDRPRAVTLLERAAVFKPVDAQLAHNLGVARSDLGDTVGARSAFAHAVALAPGNVESQFNLGVLSEESGDEAAAEQAYRAVLALTPRHARAAAGLAALCEQGNALEEAARWTTLALLADGKDAVANLTQAQLDFRAGRSTEATARLETLLRQPLSPRNRALAAGRLGMVYDRLGKPADAWRMFLSAKTALRETLGAAPEQGLYSFETAARITRQMDALLEPLTQAAGSGGETPVFLVGFPRSGTTLLDQILSSHSGLEVLEEKDTLQDFLGQFTRSDAALQELAGLDAAALETFRQRYWQRVAEYMPERDKTKCFVDKLPLNSVFMPLMARLFPGAKFIFAVRDPRDVVLSCFMQTFSLNEAMRHFLSLEETAGYYAAVMAIGSRSEEALGGRVHRIRYEDVVEDTEQAARRLLEFLELPWEPALLDFQATAKKKRINTPSYHQVAQPIYGSSRQRWRRYASQLEPVLSELQPYVKEFGYAL